MTREEQINKKVEELLDEAEIDILDRPLLRMWYSMGAKFADDNPKDGVNWQLVRIQAAIAAMQGILSNETRHDEAIESCSDEYTIWASIAIDSVEYANALVKELKGE